MYPKIFTKLPGYPHSLFSRFFVILKTWRNAQGLIVKLTAQANHNYENSSLPSSKCIGRKKITNNREKTGKKPGAQPGHPHHPRKPMKPDKAVEIKTEEKLKDSTRYVPTGNIVSRQVIGLSVVPIVTEYHAQSYTIGSRTMTKANLGEIRKMVDYWNGKVVALENAHKNGGRNRAYRAVPRDL